MAFKTDTYIIKGMRQDTSDAVYDTSFAFENKNIRIDARENNTSLSIVQEMGNEQIQKINLYNDINYTSLNTELSSLPFTVIGHCEIDKYCVLFGKSLDNDIIARLELLNGIYQLVYLYNGNLLNFDTEHPIECIANIETEQVKKVYFVDGKNKPRVIDINKQYDTTNIGNINLGFHLQLNEKFTVEKIWQHGNYPGGKVQFAFSYVNDQATETNLVEISPMFDCTATHSGLSNTTDNYSEHSFVINIENLDTQYNFIRVYLFMTTSAGTTVIKYIERNIENIETFTERIDYDEIDLINYSGTYSDLIGKTSCIIPYTIASKDNYLFYGNIKDGFPDLTLFKFNENDFNCKFTLKSIGKETFKDNLVYQYDPKDTTYQGSNFEYKGYRKDNWYRFGIIAQYETGQWSDVLFLCDKQCDKTSKTLVHYTNDNIPLYTEYFIPRFQIEWTSSGKEKIEYLYSLGFRKIKPVCVVPPQKYRNVLSQGIVAPTMYKGENRLKENLNNKTFVFPSYFYRPKPLTSPYSKIIDKTTNNVIVKPNYIYTIRNVRDLTLRKNYSDENGNGFLTNPTFTRPTDTIRFNAPYREYRHGFSLPPKDTLNAEFEFSELSLNEYFFMNDDNSINKLFIDGKNSTNILAGMYGNNNMSDPKDTNFDETFHLKILDAGIFNTNFPISEAKDSMLPKTLTTNCYSDTIFIDESVCTFNSPEVDLNDMFISNIKSQLDNCDIKVCGYAQITNSYTRMNAASTYFQKDSSIFQGGSSDIGRHLFSIPESDNNDIKKILEFTRRINTPNQPLSYHSGPFYLSPIKVLGYRGLDGNYDAKPYNIDIADVIWEGHNDFEEYICPTYSDYELENNARHLSKTYFKDKDGLSFDISWHGELKQRKQKLIISNDTALLLFQGGVSDSKYYILFPHDFYTQDAGRYTASLVSKHIRGLYTGLTLNTLSKFKLWDRPENVCNLSLRRYDEPTVTLSVENFGDNRPIYQNPYDKVYYFNDYNETIPFHRTLYNEDEWYCLGYYYFYPYYLKNFTYYRRNELPPICPMILPLVTNSIKDSYYFKTSNFTNIDKLVESHFNDCMEINEYGCHYYMPFSTVFPHSAFDPLYLCATYPFMHTDEYVGFNGNSSAYNGEYVRPLYNTTSSVLYSNVTNYFEPIESETIQDFYNAAEGTDITFDNIEWLKHNNTYTTLRYSYGIENNNIVCKSNTLPLIAATKWYRGFTTYKNIEEESTVMLGNPLTYAELYGNVMFSGLLPQLYTKCGYLPHLYFDGTNVGTGEYYWKHIQNYNTIKLNFRNKISANKSLTCELNNTMSAHIIFTNKNKVQLLPQFKFNNNLLEIIDDDLDLDDILHNAQHKLFINNELSLNDIVQFQSHYYYKVFIHLYDFYYQDNNAKLCLRPFEEYDQDLIINFANAPYLSIYPHTGKWREISVKPLNRSSFKLPFWRHNYSISNNEFNNSCFNYDRDYKEYRHTQVLDKDKESLLIYDQEGKERNIKNYWLLQIANIYNNDIEGNPYITDEGLSVNTWNWMPCGYSENINNILSNNFTNSFLIFDEGDTYFQKYNSMKTFAHPGQNRKNDVSEVASVMIESYINLDGYYFDYDELKNIDSSPLTFPEESKQKSINPVYSLSDDYMTLYHQIDTNYQSAYLKTFPTRIMWSLHKTNGEAIDSWGIIPEINTFDTIGECGAIHKLVSFNDNVYCLQEHGLSLLDFNSKSLIESSTGNPISVYFQETLRLQHNTYFSRTVGTLNKWSVIVAKNGIYWIDDTLKSFYRFPADNNSMTPLDLSLSMGFKSWSNNTFGIDNTSWTSNIFINSNNIKSFKANYDYKNNDIYWANKDICINFNELFNSFVSFYSYNNIPYIFNYKDNVYSLLYNDDQTDLYLQFANYKHKLYNKPIESYIELLVNPAPIYDKVFNFIEYGTECFYTEGEQKDFIIPYKNAYNKLYVRNSFQEGLLSFDYHNTREKFRVWRTELPRENGTINRIRSPWCKIKLWKTGEEDIEYRDQLHYISVNYTIPEQPMKTNISNN